MFLVGHYVAGRVLPFADEQVGAIYALREGTDLRLVAVLVFLWIGPLEEVFWRGFVQRRLAARLGGFAGLAVATALYAGVHVWSLNVMLMAAAGICGAAWGLLYWRYGSIWPGVVSHAVWDVAIFVLWPIG